MTKSNVSPNVMGRILVLNFKKHGIAIRHQEKLKRQSKSVGVTQALNGDGYAF